VVGASKRDPGAQRPDRRGMSAGPGAAAGAQRVLVVEDNLDQVHTLAMLLRFEGHEVDFAINGYAAIDAAERFRPDVVLLDLGLPGLDGFEVCKWLKRHPALERARLIAVTGYGTEADRDRARAAGFEHHLVKPYDPKELLSLVRGGAGST
jgi:two-component system, OmpR family, response regulator